MPESSTDDAERPHLPIVVATVLVLNVLIFSLQTVTGGSTNTSNLIRFGAQHGPSIEAGEYWRFLTAAFLHIGILHIAFNGLCLWQLGKLLERLYGTTHFAFLYLICGFAGTLCSFFMNAVVSPRTVSAGASGAIFGVAAAMVVAGLRYSDQIPESLQTVFGTGMLPFLGFNLYFGFTRPDIDNYAHVGGALAGLVCGWILHPHTDRPRDARLAAGGFAALVILCFGLQYGAVRAYENRLESAQDLFNRGDVPGAARALETISKKGAEDPRLLTMAGAVKVRQRKVVEGINTLRQAIRLAPNYAAPRLVLAETYVMTRNFPLAAMEYQAAIRLAPGNPRGHLGLGEALRAMNRIEEAGTQFREAIRLDSRLAPAHHGLALVLMHQERLDEAIRRLQTAIALEPESLGPRRDLARVLYRQGKLAEAESQVDEILRLKPDDEWAKKAAEGLALKTDLP